MNVNATQTYQQCTPPNIDTSSVFLAIRADAKGGGLGLGSSVRATFGMSLWLAIVLHTIGVETYVRSFVPSIIKGAMAGAVCSARSGQRINRINIGVDSCWNDTRRRNESLMIVENCCCNATGTLSRSGNYEGEVGH